MLYCTHLIRTSFNNQNSPNRIKSHANAIGMLKSLHMISPCGITHVIPSWTVKEE